MKWLAYAAMWLCTMAAVIAGMYITGSAWCLWGMVFPAWCADFVCEFGGEDEEE